MSDKSKAKALKIAIVGLLCGISVIAVVGISMMLKKNKADEPIATETQDPVEQEIVIEDIEPIVIEIGNSAVNVPEMGCEVQQIQEEPIIPEVPTEAPALAQDTDLTNPDKVPEYVPTEVEPAPDTTPVVEPQVPVDDGSHQGQVYVQGFGWIESSGENQTIYAPDMYENGNQIGDM